MNDEDDLHSDDDFSAAEQPTVDATNVKEFRRRGRRRKLDARRNDEFWAASLATEQGRRAMWEILVECHTFEEKFGCGPNGFPQPERTWMLAGEQAFGHRFYLSLLRIDPVKTNLMLQENDSRFAVVRKGE